MSLCIAAASTALVRTQSEVCLEPDRQTSFDEGADPEQEEPKTPTRKRPAAENEEAPQEPTEPEIIEVSTADANSETKTCGTCKRETTDYVTNAGKYVRCKMCNTLKSRMQRVFSRNEGLREDWNQLAQSAREEWIKDTEARLGCADLLKGMALHIERSKQVTNEAVQGFTKWYGDSPDLAKRYKGKEDQLAAVKIKAPKVWHELRQTYLYEDYDLTGGACTKETDSTLESVNVIRKLKATKPTKPKTGAITAKRTAAAAALPDGDANGKHLKSSETRKLEQLKAKLEKARADAGVAIAEDADRLVPEQIRVNLEVKTKELDICETDIDLVAKGDHATFDPEKVSKSTCDILKKHAAAVKSFTTVLKSITKANSKASE